MPPPPEIPDSPASRSFKNRIFSVRIWRLRFAKVAALLQRPLHEAWTHRSIVIRSLFCWAVGCVMIFSERTLNLDVRFQVRPRQLKSSDVRVLLISEADWTAVSGPRMNVIRPQKEVGYLTDSYFWNEDTWVLLLSQLLKFQPRAIGISLFFGDNIPQITQNPSRLKILEDPRIVWAAHLDSDGRVQPSQFASLNLDTSGLIHVSADYDGRVRNITPTPVNTVPFYAHLAGLQSWPLGDHGINRSSLINFQGPPGTFPNLPFLEVMDGKVDYDDVHDKIIIIGSKDSAGHIHLTPVGNMTTSELMGTLTDQIAHDKWVRRLNDTFYIFGLLILLVFSMSIIFAYPQVIALATLFLAGSFEATLAAWSFDQWHIWVPILAPLAQLSVTFVVMQSYQLSLNEQRAYKLEQDRRYFTELDQLKDNFISLISHDLKTPIARLQAIVDRLSHAESSDTQPRLDDLKSIRTTSEELNHYIQSILRVSRVESNRILLRMEAVDVNHLIEKTMDRLRDFAVEKKVNLQSNTEPLFSIDGDPDLLFEVILNLVENAIKYTPSNGSIHVRSHEQDDEILVMVEDTGAGIPPEELPRIWDKFYRGQEQNLITKGTGLGLYLVKYFVERHGGRVFAYSQVGLGSTIGFALPTEVNSLKQEEA